jgi:hypothetical protein
VASEKNLITADYTYLTDVASDYVIVSDAPAGPLVTPNAALTTRKAALTTGNVGLVSKDRHLIARSSGATVVARSNGKDVFVRGGTSPLTTPNAPLVMR